jgi:LacI family transcriptional regulator
MRHVTIKDVAAAAGVSVGTASKALNGRGKLRAETRARVLRATEQLGFVPNALARSLLAGRSFSAALITPETFGRLSLQVMFGAQEVLCDGHIPVLVGEIRGDPCREQRYMETFSARQVDGLIIASRRIESVQALRATPVIPVVHALGRPPGEGVSALPDVEGGARMAAEHLLAIGRHRIAHVTGPESMPAARLQARGFDSALKAAGAEPCGSVMYGQWSESWGREAAGRLLPRRPDAIFCGSDQIARGAADTLRALGRRIPDDVALVGCGNWGPVILGALPELTSVDLCLDEVGRVAARCLLAALAGEAPQGVHRVPAQLVVRQSSAGRDRRQAVQETAEARPGAVGGSALMADSGALVEEEEVSPRG